MPVTIGEVLLLIMTTHVIAAGISIGLLRPSGLTKALLEQAAFADRTA